MYNQKLIAKDKSTQLITLEWRLYNKILRQIKEAIDCTSIGPFMIKVSQIYWRVRSCIYINTKTHTYPP